MNSGTLGMFQDSYIKAYPLWCVALSSIVVPVVASIVYSAPETMQSMVKHFNYVTYPPQGEKPPSSNELEKYLKEQKGKR
mmetsp:Transcript_6918/g.9146  ORF Transcript_6918/g.9146 Transcript_6918/m.9146 type:complete len:80 (+) Transcript_6918:185-424(+)